MAEKTPNQQLAEKLLFKPAYVGDKSAAVKQEAHAFAEGQDIPRRGQDRARGGR